MSECWLLLLTSKEWAARCEFSWPVLNMVVVVARQEQQPQQRQQPRTTAATTRTAASGVANKPRPAPVQAGRVYFTFALFAAAKFNLHVAF